MPNTTAPQRTAIDIEALVQVFAKASYMAEGYPTATHAGVAAVLDALATTAQYQAAADADHYDHRSLYAFASRLHQASRPG